VGTYPDAAWRAIRDVRGREDRSVEEAKAKAKAKAKEKVRHSGESNH
jgi:hypothetical protein